MNTFLIIIKKNIFRQQLLYNGYGFDIISYSSLKHLLLTPIQIASVTLII